MKNENYLTEYKDMYNIYNLITKIDKGYKLYFDNIQKLFIIINTAKNNQICLKISQISPIIIKLLQESRIENLNNIIKNVDIENEKIKANNIKKFKDNMMTKMVEMTKFTKRASNILDCDIKKFIGG